MAARVGAAASTAPGGGTSAAARVGAQPAANTARSTEAGTGTTTTDTRDTKAEVDADGFRTVRGNAWRRREAAAARASERAEEQQRGAALGQAGGVQGEDGGEEGQATEGADAEDAPPSAEDLHQAWLDEVAVVRRLRQQGLANSHPAMEAACKTRDDAEALWRGAKDPAPPAVRLSRMQAKLDRAVALQAESRQAIIELERAHKAKLAELQAKLDEDTERVRLRRRQLGEVQDEIAQGGNGGEARAKQGQAVQQVHAALSNTIAPTISALVDQLESSTPAWSILNGLLGTLSSSQTMLEEAMATKSTTQTFDIGDGTGVERGDDDEGDRDSGSTTDWSESHEMRDVRSEAGLGNQAGGQGDARAGAWPGNHDADQTMGAGGWWNISRADWDAGVRWQACGHGKWARSGASWADTWEDERAKEQEGSDQPAVARRRLEPAPQVVPSGTGGGDSSTGSTGADEARQRQQHEARVQQIVAAAIAAGVQPITGTGDDLRMLDANQLDAWAAENLQADGPHV